MDNETSSDDGTVLRNILKTKTKIAGVRGEETGLSKNLGTSGKSEDLDMIGFDLPRDTEKGVRCLEEQVQDNEVPMEVIPEINLRKTHSVLHSQSW